MALDDEPLTDSHVWNVCRPGEGAGTCAFLVFGGGWRCAKGSELETELRVRVAAGTINARGDNCAGPPDYTPSAA